MTTLVAYCARASASGVRSRNSLLLVHLTCSTRSGWWCVVAFRFQGKQHEKGMSARVPSVEGAGAHQLASGGEELSSIGSKAVPEETQNRPRRWWCPTGDAGSPFTRVGFSGGGSAAAAAAHHDGSVAVLHT